MATVDPTLVAMPNVTVQMVKWEGIGNGDIGGAVEMPTWPDRSVQVLGSFFSGTFSIEGSLDGTTWATLTDPQGNALTFTAAKIEAITELVRYIRPGTVGSGDSGGTTDIDVWMIFGGRVK